MITPTVTALAGTAAAAVLDLTRATVAGGGYQQPADLATVIAELDALTGDLSQLLGQAEAWLTRRHASGRIGTDNKVSADATVHAAVEALRHAQHQADALAATLTTVRDHTSHLTCRTPIGQPAGRW